MTSEDVACETQVNVNFNKISISLTNFGQLLTVNYNIEDDSIILGSKMNEISLDSVAEILGDKIDVEKLYMEISDFLKNTQVITEKPPLVLKNQMQLEKSTKKL